MLSVAGSRNVYFGLLVSALMAGLPAQFGAVAAAGTVDIFSQPGNGSNNMGGTNEGIPTSPAWYMPPPGSPYEWISYGATGCNTFVPLTGLCTAGPQNPAGTTVTGTPTAVFYATFTVTDPNDSGWLYVWADDTAGVWLDPGTVTSGNGDITGATMEFAPNGNLGNNCAEPQPIGCTAGTQANIFLSLGPGTYTLVFDAYQLIGGSPFGVMYDGVLTSTPEPASYMLMGLGLAGLGTLVRRRKRA